MNRTKIPYCDFTWNPVIGCSRVSEGCQNCYALAMARRLEAIGKKTYLGLTVDDFGGVGEKDGLRWSRLSRSTGKVCCLPERLTEPLRLRKPSRIFVCSMSDLFHEKVPLEFIADVFDVMASATADCGKNHQHEEECWCGPPHTFLILTKRPARMLRVLTGDGPQGDDLPFYIGEIMPGDSALSMSDWPLPNVWLGVTCENQARADERIPLLLQTPAALRFVSCEPMLEPINLSSFILHPSSFSWVICGGESGPHARPFSLDWARSLRDQCLAAGIPFFMKQGGRIRYQDLPADLQIRQFPIGDCHA